MKRTNLMLLAVVVILVAQPLLLPIPNQLGEPFPGADDQGKKALKFVQKLVTNLVQVFVEIQTQHL